MRPNIYALVWCDTVTSLNRSLERRALREFAMRVAFQMSAEDSANLLDLPLASKRTERCSTMKRWGN